MKKTSILIAAIAVFIAAVVSCEKPAKVKINPVYFESFGFTTETTGDLDQDYVVTNLASKNKIDIMLVAGTLESIVDTLKPVFTFPEPKEGDDEVIVTVADTLITSGVTKMSFKEPVEFRLQKGNENAIYIVNVTIQPSNFKQVAIGAVEDTLYTDVAATINAKDEIWIGNFLRTKKDVANYPVLYKFANGTLSSKIVVSEERANTPVFVGVDPAGDPYLSVATYNGSSKAGQSVFKYSGGTSTLLGTKSSIYTFNANGKGALLPYSANKIFVGGWNNAAKTSPVAVARYVLNMAEYDGSDWTNGAGPSGRVPNDPNGTGYRGTTVKGKIINGVPYIAIKPYGSAGTVNTVSLYKFNGSTWDVVLENVVFKKNDGSDAESLAVYFFDFDVDSNGMPHFLVGAQLSTDNYDAVVMKVDPATKTQSIVGGVTGFKIGLTPAASLAFDKKNNPYVAYDAQDGSGRVFISYIDENTKTWVRPEPVTDEEAGDPVILFDSKNNIYVITDIDSHPAVYVRK